MTKILNKNKNLCVYCYRRLVSFYWCLFIGKLSHVLVCLKKPFWMSCMRVWGYLCKNCPLLTLNMFFMSWKSRSEAGRDDEYLSIKRNSSKKKDLNLLKKMDPHLIKMDFNLKQRIWIWDCKPKMREVQPKCFVWFLAKDHSLPYIATHALFMPGLAKIMEDVSMHILQMCHSVELRL